MSAPHLEPAPAPASAADQPRGLLAGLRALHEDEGGSAAVEFIVLIPVYILLMTGLFSLTQLVLCRQAIVGAARYEAWTGKALPGAREFFTSLPGTYTSNVRVTSGREFHTQNELQVQGNEGAELGPGRRDQAARMALELLNNTHGDAAPLELVRNDASFAYSGLLVGTRNVTISTKAAVVLMAKHTRPEHHDGEQKHPISDVQGAPFDPAAADNRYLSPTEGLSHFGFSMGADPGIWSVRARIDGSPYSEHSYYAGQPKPR
jgi:hypothetical protein